MSPYGARTPIAVRRATTEMAGHLKTWRKLRGLTQAQVAERAGVARMTVHRLEAGDPGVSLETFLRVLRAVGVLDQVVGSLDPYDSDVGRLRADERLPERVRPRKLNAGD